jgi:hypothetical protein
VEVSLVEWKVSVGEKGIYLLQDLSAPAKVFLVLNDPTDPDALRLMQFGGCPWR